MIKYSIEIYDENTERLVNEVDISNEYLPSLVNIMGWSEDDKDAFIAGIAGFNISEGQAKSLEILLGKHFFSKGLILQISGGEI